MDFEFLYTYIKTIISEEKDYVMSVIDSLKYSKNDFFEKVEYELMENDFNEGLEVVQFFALCVSKDREKDVKESLLEDILRRLDIPTDNEDNSNFFSDMYNKYIDTYVNYLIDNCLSPLIFPIEFGGVIVYLLIGSKKYLEKPPEIIMGILESWYQKEKPILFGKQILTKPFFYKKLINRKTLNIIPSYNDNNLYLLLEGNIKVELDYSTVSMLDYHDNIRFNATDIQKISYNPVYALGYTFEPEINFLDWFDIYLYVMAILDVDLEDLEKIKLSYMTFLDFINNHICEKIYADGTIIKEDLFFNVLNINIKNIKEFIRRKRRSGDF